MSKKLEPVALGEYVIFESKNIAAPGQDEVSPAGIIVGKSVGEVPKFAEVISVGPDVPESAGITVGDKISLPNGNMKNVPDPEVAFNGVAEKDGRKISVAHYKLIAAVYK